MMCCVGSCAKPANVVLYGKAIGGSGYMSRDLPYCTEHWEKVEEHYTPSEFGPA